MQAIGTYQGWETPSYTISVSPEDVADLLFSLKRLQKLTDYNYTRDAKWRKLIESMHATDFGLARNTTEVIECSTDLEIAE